MFKLAIQFLITKTCPRFLNKRVIVFLLGLIISLNIHAQAPPTIQLTNGYSSPICAGGQIYATITAPNDAAKYRYFNIEYSIDGISNWFTIPSINGYFNTNYDNILGELTSPPVQLSSANSYFYRARFAGTVSNLLSLNPSNTYLTQSPYLFVQVLEVPEATIGGSAVVCMNSSNPILTFTGSRGSSPYEFTYTINGISSQTITSTTGSSTTLSVPTNNSGNFDYQLVSVKELGSIRQCSNNIYGQVASVTVNPLPVAAIASSVSTVCKDGTSPTITFTGSGATAPYVFTYSLNSGASQTITTTSGNSVSISVPVNAANSFTYVLSGVSESGLTGCSNTASGTASVTVNPLPIVTITNPSAVCAPNAIDLTTSSITAGSTSSITYSYYTDAAATTVLTTPSAITTTGTYYIKGTTASNCSKVEPASVTVNPLPTVVITNPSAVCAPNAIDLTASSITAGSTSSITYSYYTDAAATTVLTTPSAVTTTGTYYIKGTTTESCTDINEVEVEIKPIPSKPVITSNSPICEGVNLNLTTANVTGGTFSWTGVNNFTSSDQNPTIATVTSIASGSYTATVTVDGCVSEASDPITVVVNAKPTIIATASKNVICEGETITLTASGAGLSGTYFWDNGNTNNLISLSTSTSKTYSVTGTDDNGCFNSSSVAVTVNSIPDFTINNTTVCLGNPQNIRITPSTGVLTDYNYLWTVPSGVTAPGSVSSFVTTVPGVYSGKIIDKTTSCESIVKNTTATFYPLPNAAVIVATNNKVMEGNSIDLTAAASGGTAPYTYTWIPNNTTNYSISGGASAVFSAIKEGIVNVKYQVKDANNCLTQSADFEITIAPAVIIFDLPNAFTPNGDGLNDVLKVISNAGVTTLNSLKIFSRSGNLVFQSQDLSRGWDGSYNGNTMPTDIYYWTAVYVDRNGVTNSKTGTVLLLK